MARSYPVRVASRSSEPLTGWAVVTVPVDLGDVAEVVKADMRRVTPYAVRTQRFGVAAQYAVHVRDVVSGGPLNLDLRASSTESSVLEFPVAPSITDAPEDLRPVVEIRAGGRAASTALVPASIVAVERNAARVVWRVSGHGDGFHLDAWLYVASGQAHVPYEALVTWSDPTTAELRVDIDAMTLSFGEPFVVDFARSHGWGMPFEAGGRWHSDIRPGDAMGDGEQVYVSGRVLPTSDIVRRIREGANAQDIAELQSLIAARTSDLTAELVDGDEPLMVFRPAELTTPPPALPVGVGYYAQRPIGPAKITGTTGAQEDFGSTKGSDAYRYRPSDYARVSRYAATTPMRGFHFREADGSRVLAGQHPGTVTWSCRPDHRLSTDMLGKPDEWMPWSLRHGVSGFSGIDDQHRSLNNEAACILMTGSYALQESWRDLLEVDRMMPADRVGAARAVGRLAHQWAHHALIDGHHAEEIITRAVMRIERAANVMRLLGGDLEDPMGTMLTISAHRRDRFAGATHAQVWEEAIAVRGIYAVVEAARRLNMAALAARAERIVLPYVQSLTTHCIRRDNTGSWRTAAYIRLQPNAVPLTDAEFFDPAYAELVHSFDAWTLPAVLVRLELEPEWSDGIAILRALRPNGPQSALEAEWLCIGDRWWRNPEQTVMLDAEDTPLPAETDTDDVCLATDTSARQAAKEGMK